MGVSTDRVKILQEIDLIPEEKLPEIYDLLHHFRLGLQADQDRAAQDRVASILRFAGCWQDMPAKAYTAFVQEIAERRHQAFSRRRNSEADSN